MLREILDATGTQFTASPRDGSSDYAPFVFAGIPVAAAVLRLAGGPSAVS